MAGFGVSGFRVLGVGVRAEGLKLYVHPNLTPSPEPKTQNPDPLNTPSGREGAAGQSGRGPRGTSPLNRV